MIAPAATLRGAALAAAGATDPGRVRQGNEDRLYVDVERGLFLVVDGVGGRAAGEVASAIAVDIIPESIIRIPGSPEQRVREAITLANNEIHRQSQASDAYRGMTCVLTVALLTGRTLTIGHVGDSRLYKITASGIAKVTRDHSPVGEQEDNGEISEDEAMHHPRRNEVFRDVGAVRHQPRDPEFIEIVETSLEPDAAILLCSDGLSDMLASGSILRIVHQHAGNPADVVEGLIAAANHAGGRDNITAVYAEGTAFAETLNAPASPAADAPPPRPSRSRIAWFGGGIVSGIVAAITLVGTIDLWPYDLRGRTLVVGGASSAYASISAAMAAARPRDVVQVEPGIYQEEVVLADGVTLKASVPGSVRLVAPPGRLDWVSLTADGSRGSTISGLRIIGTPEAPIAAGVKLAGTAGASIDDVTFEGNIEVGLDVQNDGATLLRASRFRDVRGVPLRIGGGSAPVLRQNLFVQGPHEGGPAVHVQDDARPTLEGNVFVGYVEAIGAPAGRRDHLIRDNYVIPRSHWQPAERRTP